jgi:hypothetical protein
MMDANAPDFVEAAIYVPTNGEHWGKYTAACAKEVCGYCGMSLFVAYTLIDPHRSLRSAPGATLR